jgi:predicted nucleic acid-binding protein
VKKLFLDSDVILDALLKRPQFEVEAKNLIKLAYDGRLTAVTSSAVFVNVSYFLDKFDRANHLNLLRQLRDMIAIISVGEKIIDQALNSNFLDFEDAVQYYAAVSSGCEVIITRNAKDYKQSTIPVSTAEQFLRTIL